MLARRSYLEENPIAQERYIFIEDNISNAICSLYHLEVTGRSRTKLRDVQNCVSDEITDKRTHIPEHEVELLLPFLNPREIAGGCTRSANLRQAQGNLANTCTLLREQDH